MLSKFILPLLSGFALIFNIGIPACFAQTNLLIGTAGDGMTYPAAGVPFGMTQWAPQTHDGEVKCTAPYYYSDNRIQGFRGTHFPSGSCMQDYGSVTLMPVAGEVKLDAAARSSSFTHDQEESSPYYYAVTLSDYQIRTDITGLSHASIMRFAFQRAGKAWIVVQDNSRPGDGSIIIDTRRNEIYGFNPVRRLYAGQGKLAGFSGYFVVRFDRPFTVGGTWSGSTRRPGATMQASDHGAPGAYVGFVLKPGAIVQAKVGMSFTSIEEARRNLDAEIPAWDFSAVEQRARAQWDAVLKAIDIDEPDTAKRTIFYTALYHAFLLPRAFSDVSGTYPGFAGEGRTETARGFTYLDDMSLWDTFRAVHPLFTILAPDRDLDAVKSLIAKGQQGGFLPIFPAWNSYTSEMVGDHGGAVIADAYAKGIRGFDVEEAYRLMRQNATELPKTQAEYIDGRGRRGLESYLKFGYIPLEDPVPSSYHPGEQVTRTIEYAYDDFAVGQLARALGRQADAALFSRRSLNYRNVIDPSTGFARGRHQDGSWASPFDPSRRYPYITEGLPYQNTFFAPQDMNGLVALLGGPGKFVAKLDALFAGGYYDQGNEPSHEIAYLYDYAGAAWKTQMHVRHILESQYFNRPDGLPGNDDCGQISAWYIFGALGFYPVTPGLPEYRIGAPLFDNTTIHLPNGRSFRIEAPGASAGKLYIRSAVLNGKPLSRTWITHQEILAGGTLSFEMSSQPSPQWPKPLQ